MNAEDRNVEPHRDPDLSTPPERTSDPTGDTDLDADRRDLRADIGKYTSLVELPATTRSLIDSASANGAPDFVLRALRELPADERFESARELWIALDLEATERF